MTASAKALAPSSPVLFSLRYSEVIDWLASSCFDVWTLCLKLVSHSDHMTALRKRGCVLQTQMSVYVTKCVWPAYRAHVFQHTLSRQPLAVDKVMKSSRGPAVDTRSATCLSPGTAEFKISELMLFSTQHRRVAANLKYCSSAGELDFGRL